VSTLGVMYKLLTAGLCVVVLAAGGAASATTVVVTLDAGTIPAGVQCGETWTEAGVVLSFVPTTAEDCTEGSCYFGFGGLDDVDLYPARLNADLSALAGMVLSAEVDIIDYCGVGCTLAFLYEGATTSGIDSNAAAGSPETLHLFAGAGITDRLAVSSCEGGVAEIRIELGGSPVESATWATVKALYH
jgi:hypothetical protein